MAVKHLIGRRGIGYSPGSVKYILTHGLTPNDVDASYVWELPAQSRTATLEEQSRIATISRQTRNWTLEAR